MGTVLAEAVARELRLRIGRVPRVQLGEFPTPLTELIRLSRHLGSARIFMKREDLSGLALGGNKTRLLEFRLAEALSLGADVVIAGLEVESNSARQLTAAANRLGLRTVLLSNIPASPPGRATCCSTRYSVPRFIWSRPPRISIRPCGRRPT